MAGSVERGGGQERLGRRAGERKGEMGSGPRTDKGKGECSLSDGVGGQGPELVLGEGEAPGRGAGRGLKCEDSEGQVLGLSPAWR